MKTKIKNALISVSDKENLTSLLKALKNLILKLLVLEGHMLLLKN